MTTSAVLKRTATTRIGNGSPLLRLLLHPVSSVLILSTLVGSAVMLSQGNADWDEHGPNKALKFATGGTGLQYQIVDGKGHKRVKAYNDFNVPVSIGDWADLLHGTDEISELHIANFMETVKTAASGYDAIFLETKGTKVSNQYSKHFECVVVNAPRLFAFINEESPNVDAFSEHFEASKKSSTCVSFPNLFNTAILISPKPQTSIPLRTYTDLASFLRNAPSIEIISLWKSTMNAYKTLLSSKSGTVWLSTSGLGVAWVHVRLDSTPKYYSFREFAAES